MLSTIRQKVFDKQAREGLRGRPLWKGFRVLGAARPRPQGVEVQLERAAHGVAHGGKPSARRVRETVRKFLAMPCKRLQPANVDEGIK